MIAEFEGRTFVARTRIHRFRDGKAPPADPAALRRLPPAASVGMTPAAPAAPARAPAPVRYSNSPPAPLSA